MPRRLKNLAKARDWATGRCHDCEWSTSARPEKEPAGEWAQLHEKVTNHARQSGHAVSLATSWTYHRPASERSTPCRRCGSPEAREGLLPAYNPLTGRITHAKVWLCQGCWEWTMNP